MKVALPSIDATPSKRLYLSIIADYDIKTALCELIDNALDNWNHFAAKPDVLKVSVELDYERQVIIIIDNSGGIKAEDIKMIVSPGTSRNDGTAETIGVFGVGSKRAVVALGQDVKIASRFKSAKTLLIEIDDEWVSDESWELPVYQTRDMEPGSTRIEISKLRSQLLRDNEQILVNHLGATYSEYLKTGNFILQLNGSEISPVDFDSWSYPPEFTPNKIFGELDFAEKGKVKFELLGGLTKSGDPSGAEYGAYFYCNNRLISRGNKSYDMGYKAAFIGQPHPSVSIARVIVKLHGPAQLMPWNSSKSDLNSKHDCFNLLQYHICRLLTHYSTVAKRYSTGGGWENTVFKHVAGSIEEQLLDPINGRYLLPSIPRPIQQKYPQLIKTENRDIALEKPWTRGLYESIIAVNELPKLKLEQNNRISLIILDSALEIGFKDYLAHEKNMSEAKLAGIVENRSLVHSEVEKVTSFKKGIWNKVDYYYKLRCSVIHGRVSVSIPDDDLLDFRSTVEYILNKLFGLKFI